MHRQTAKKETGSAVTDLRSPAGVKSSEAVKYRPMDRIKSALVWEASDFHSQKYRIKLYRFLTDQVPVVSACVWTWVRLSAAKGGYKITNSKSGATNDRASNVLERLSERMFTNALGQRVGLTTLLPELFMGLYRDGFFGGFLALYPDGSGVNRFVPVDPTLIVREEDSQSFKLMLDTEQSKIDLNRPDFYYLPFGIGNDDPLGGSILKSVPFVSYIEQQLVDDMRRASHNSGYHRLHVKITPPERSAGESEPAFTDRSNKYFDDTVDMIRECDVNDNPVTWDNVAIEYVGPSGSKSGGGSWFTNHRAMIEEICAGTNLAPFLLGYSYGATTTWSGFKFDIVMRQVRTVQAQVSRFLEWIGNIELALAGVDATCRYEFDNTLSYRASEQVTIETNQVNNLLRLYEAGLIEKELALKKAGGLV